MHRLTMAATVLFGILAGCYQDDALHPAAIAPTKVFLTDDPFPFDAVGSVNIYVTRIEASTSYDTTNQTGSWVTIAAPNKSFDLLTLQQGDTAFVGQGTIDAGHYVTIRMTIDVDKSSVKYVNGANAVVHWPTPPPGSTEIDLNALVEAPLAVSAAGSKIVIVFDVGRSFLYNLTNNQDFLMLPILRAVNSVATGSIGGVITAPDIEGNPTPVKNADITVYGGDPSRSSLTWNVEATGRTSADGHYTVAYLPAGTWIVRVEQPNLPGLDPVTTTNVVVTAGATTPLSVFLPRVGGGSSFIRIAGLDTVAIGGAIALVAAVGDSTGIPVANPVVNWLSRDTTVALVLQDSSHVGDSLASIIVLGRSAGTTWIVASSGTLSDSVLITVVDGAPLNNPVASIILNPASRTVVVNDSGSFVAELRDSVGNLLTNRQISWFLTDSSGVADLVWASGVNALVYGRHSGTTHLRVASESKFKDATITVP